MKKIIADLFSLAYADEISVLNRMVSDGYLYETDRDLKASATGIQLALIKLDLDSEDPPF